ncbi:MAG: HlyC/CorC family transporter [Spirochaetes bacterium]|uniref:HlyC/CorC family transporter n=1 Tax=Candidatus Avitreponema avistercoris TaxID=2840705 RepID=A0A9D9HFR2_9SPIR|nr:HlyC/CorC family transporter [Candidatus Avitreponema avistercoris]
MLILETAVFCLGVFLEDVLWSLILQLILILLNAVFACAEIAVVSVNEAKISQMAEKGNRKASRLQKLIKDPARFLSTIQIAITLSGFLGSAFAADNFSVYIASWITGFGFPVEYETVRTISIVLITLILSYVTLIFGELVPKRIAMKKAEALAFLLSGLITFISKLFAPVVWLLTVSTNTVLRLFGFDPEEDDGSVSEEEIRLMVDEGSRKGVIDAAEKEMIQNIFEFDDLQVGEFATHRQDVVFLLLGDGMEEWNALILKSGHENYPVCENTADSVIGVLSASAYFRLEDKSRENVMAHAVKPAWFIPETLKADVVFKKMKEAHRYFAVVLDEYGGMTGVVTVNDLLEQLVGDFTALDADEKDAGEDIAPAPDGSGSWQIRGGASLDDVSEQLGVELPLDEYDTFGGYVLGEYGSIPDDGSVFTVETPVLRVRVTEIKDRRVLRTVVWKRDVQPVSGAEN